jgi:hypothetical protein
VIAGRKKRIPLYTHLDQYTVELSECLGHQVQSSNKRQGCHWIANIRRRWSVSSLKKTLYRKGLEMVKFLLAPSTLTGSMDLLCYLLSPAHSPSFA